MTSKLLSTSSATAENRELHRLAPRLDPAGFAQMVSARHEQHVDPARSLCLATVEVLRVSGAGLVLMSGRQSLDFIGVSDGVSEEVEQLEYTLGEGPCDGRDLARKGKKNKSSSGGGDLSCAI